MPKIYTASSFGNIHTRTTSRTRTKLRRSYRPNRVGLPMQFDSFFSKFGSLNKFYFQIIGMTMVTVAVVLIFYSAFEFTSPGVDASDGNENIRILTNFQKGDYSRSSNAQLVEIQQENKTEEQAKPESVITEYIVEFGDSISVISLKTGIEIETLIQFNNLVEPYNLEVGQKILIP
ncbi:MAG: LysM peptidoglycan-binding domain-containing protein [Thermales bacterium]|nr:LysM peptidoglycan-binding domain-containing protein [Thermales bacterium]